MHRAHSASGFSLIELMIVVSIIGILATLAIPSYQRYTQRARFAEIIQAAQLFKITVSLALQQGIPLAELMTNKHGIPAEPKSTKHLASLTVDKGIITAIGTAIVDGATYILKPNNDGTQWVISGSCIKYGLCHGE